MLVTVSDGTDTDTDGFTWTVTNTNRAPAFSTDLQSRTDAEGDLILSSDGLDADATDADGDTLTYSATGLPDGISISPSTGAISGTLSFASAGMPHRAGHRQRRHRHRHRRLHLDGDRHQPGAGLQHRPAVPHRRRG